MQRLYGKTVLIGLGSFAACVIWSVYGTYVPLILNAHVASTFLIGLTTAATNFLGAALHPVFGALSDKTNTRFGRRMPYLLIGVPMSAAILAFIPAAQNIVALIVLLVLLNAAMSIWRTPSFALLPDLTPPGLLSQSNGVMNFMGGLGMLLAFGAGGLLFNQGGMPLPFAAAAAVAVLALVVMKLFIREPAPALPQDGGNDAGEAVDRPSGASVQSKKRSLIAALLSLIFYSIGINAIEVFFSLYVTTSLKDAAGNPLTGGDASLLMGAFSLTFLLCSIPMGFIASRIGRKKTILIALVGAALLLCIFYAAGQQSLLIPMLIAGSACCAAANTGFLPVITGMAGHSTFGKYTGYYHFVTFSSTIISPLLFGLIRDWAQTYDILFLFSGIAFFVALIPLLFVAKGDGEAQ